jgi:pyrimidine operon attenuation protein/uracil phosphoribosyltransferase
MTLNSGTTLIYAIRHLDVPLKIQNSSTSRRNHKKYPVKADFKGISFHIIFRARSGSFDENGNNTPI